MNYQESKKQILKIFNRSGFVDEAKQKRNHTHQVLVETCSNGTQIRISFPGYKAFINKGKAIYDYRVDILKSGITTAMSHANIIVDIYNKITHGNLSAEALKEVLIEISREGETHTQNIENKLQYESVTPTKELKSRIKNIHKSLDKTYNETGNSFDLTIEELMTVIKWIVLQEDINYPIPKFEGRKMPFARYLETIFITQNNPHTLEDVVKRALSHKRPVPWEEVDYSFRENVL